MFDVGQYLAAEKNHLPLGFNAKNGLRSLFPPGYQGSISILKNYVYRAESQGVDAAQMVVGADGTGRWVFAALVDFSSTNAIQVSWCFEFSNNKLGLAYGFPIYYGTPWDASVTTMWVWCTGVDPWIADNWPQIFAKGCFFNNDAITPVNAGINHGFEDVFPLEGGQQTYGYGPVFGENGLGVAEPGGAETPCFRLGNVLNGLPVSDGSHYYYYPSGGGYYTSGTKDPWSGFDFSPLQISASNGIGAGILAWAGPDPGLQTGTQNTDNGNSRVVIAVVLNNTDSVLTIPSGSAISTSAAGIIVYPQSPIPPGSTMLFANGESGVGTQGSVQFYASRLGDPLIDNILDPKKLITLTWDNPYVGGNSYSASCSPPYSVSWLGGDGDTAVIIFNITG